MNIQVLTPNFIRNVRRNDNKPVNNQVQTAPLQTLTRDTVSFSGRLPMKPATTPFADCLEKCVENSRERMTRLATTYIDILESIANSLKNDGFSFDRAYCEQSPVKSAKSYVSKITRSKSLVVPDAIRSTLYCNKPYDLSLLTEKLLPEMRKRGYVLAEVETPVKELMKRGCIPAASKQVDSTMKVPDLDIRLDSSQIEFDKFPQQLRYCIGKPQKSGYEDIQMRFVRLNDKSPSPVNHELIVVFGPNYAQAKHIESEKVYAYLREFENFNMKFDDSKLGSDSQKANRYEDLIKQMFRGKISQKLFLNAKNKDLYDINEEIPITFSADDKKVFEANFEELKKYLHACYREQRNTCAGDEEKLTELMSAQRHDSNLLKKIHDGLSSTIEFFTPKKPARKAKSQQ